MNRFPTSSLRMLGSIAACLALGAVLAWPQSADGGWRKFGDDPQVPTAAPAEAAPAPQNAPQSQPAAQEPDRAAQPAPYGVPLELNVKAGAYLNVRVNDALSSNRNHPGDTFSATLAQPLVVDGIIVAARGQTVFGRVVEAQKSSANSPSRLGVELDEITLVDGEQAPLRTQLTSFARGRTPSGQQAGTILTTTALGTMIGHGVGWGTGAAIGAGAGALAGTVAILMTRNQPTVIYPETAMTFRIESPFTVSTARAPQAFRYADPNDYSRPVQAQVIERRPAAPCYGCVPPVWGSVYEPYPYYGSPYYYGPGFGVVIGRGFGRRW